MSRKDEKDQMVSAITVEAVINGVREEMGRWIQERELEDEKEMTTLMQKYVMYHPEPRTTPELEELPLTNSWKETKPFGEKKIFREPRLAPTKQDLEKITYFKCQRKRI